MLKDINPGGSSTPQSFCNVNGTFFFTVDDGTHGRELWKTDGTPDGTMMVADINPNGAVASTPISLVNVSGTLYFTADDGTHGRELWKSDGSPGGTSMVTDIRPGSGSSNPSSLILFNSSLYFRRAGWHIRHRAVDERRHARRNAPDQ